jgi:hypothetical protein
MVTQLAKLSHINVVQTFFIKLDGMQFKAYKRLYDAIWAQVLWLNSRRVVTR